MASVRVLVGTRKGAFILTSDGKREKWDVSGPHFARLGDLPPQRFARRSEPHLRLAIERLVRPADPALRATAARPGKRSATSSSTTARPARTCGTTARRIRGNSSASGTSSPRSPTPTRLRRRRRRRPLPYHRRRPDLARTARPARPRHRTALAARRRRHVPAHDPCSIPAIRSASTSPSPPPARSAPTMAARPGSRSTAACTRSTFPTRPPKSATASIASPCIRSRPNALFMQKHWDVMRSDDAGDNWHEVSGNLPTDFGFVIDVHAHEPETIYVVPIKSDSEHFPPDGKLRVYRSRTGGNEWEPLTKGLPQENCYRECAARRDGGRFARFVRHLFRHDRRPGLCLGRCRRQLDAHRPRSSGRAQRRSANVAINRTVVENTDESK